MSGEFFIGVAITGITVLFCAVVVFVNLVIKLKIEVEGLKNSTHSIQYVPVDRDNAFESLTDKEKESLTASMQPEGFEVNLS